MRDVGLPLDMLLTGHDDDEDVDQSGLSSVLTDLLPPAGEVRQAAR